MLYYLIKIISWIIFHIFFGLRVTGSENIPARGPFVIVANHTSVFDGFILVSAIKLKIIFLSAAYLFNTGFYGIILRGIGAIPVKRDGNDIRALKKSIKVLRNSGILGIFPQGRIMKDDNNFSAKAGAAYLAVKTKVPILPIAIRGADKALPVGKKWPKFNRIEVHIGKVIETSKIYRGNKKDIFEIVEAYMKEIH